MQEVNEKSGVTGEEHKHKVPVTIDGRTVEVASGQYVVSQLKAVLGVDPSRELERVVHGNLVPLKDDEKIAVHKDEVFVSHVRGGGSSHAE